jgi:eukaryotic-like serine/threonine-protein kinase
MTPEQFTTVERLFHDALQIPPAQREEWIAEHTAGDPDAAQWLRLMLEGEQTSSAPQRFGPYRVLRKLGQGGMGSVFLAERDDGQYERQVAVKTLSGPFQNSYLVERFRQECRILASLDHPGIARLLDSGFDTSGQPYLVMEFIDGLPLDEYSASLPPRERLGLFRAICGAVSYAHQRLVVHRDLKPSNILVSSGGMVKLLDFGTARLMETDAAPGVTQNEWRAYTPEYASPEQVSGAFIGTGSDVYSLGVILYRLLAGRAPYSITDRSPASLVRAVIETHPSPPGSDADLNAIVSRALRKLPEERYESVAEMDADVGRYLDGSPVVARRGDTWYRTRKFLARYRWYVAAAASVLLLVAIGTGAVLWQYRIAQERNAELRRLTGTVLSEFYSQVLDLPGSTGAQRVLLGRALESLDRLAMESSNDVWVQRQLADGYLKLAALQADPYGQNLGDVAGGVANAEKALRILGERPRDREGQLLRAVALRTKASILFGSGGAGALEAAKKSALAFEALGEAQGAALSWSVVGDIHGQIGTYNQGSVEESIAAYERAKQRLEQILARKPGDARAERSLNGLRIKIGNALLFSDPAKAAPLFAEAARTIRSMPTDTQRRSGMRRMLGLAEAKLARAQAALQNPEAVQHGQAALDIAKGFAAISAGDSRAQDDLALSYLDNAVILDQLGKPEAAAFYRLAASTAAELRRRQPENPRFRSIEEETRAMAGMFNPDLKASGEAALADILRRAQGPEGQLFDWDAALGVLTHPHYNYRPSPREALDLARRAVAKTSSKNAYYLSFLAFASREPADAKAALAGLSPGPTYTRRRLEEILHAR